MGYGKIQGHLSRQIAKGRNGSKNNIRLSMPFDAVCLTCRASLSKNMRANAFKEQLQNRSSCGAAAFRFTIKCKGCLETLTIITDPESGEYLPEHNCARIEPREGGTADSRKLIRREDTKKKDEMQVMHARMYSHAKMLLSADSAMVLEAVRRGTTAQALRREALLRNITKEKDKTKE